MDVKTMKLLDEKIEKFSLPVPIRVTRFVSEEALASLFNIQGIAGKSPKELIKYIKNTAIGERLSADPGYLSASLDEKANLFARRPVKLEIEVEPGTNLYMTNNYEESEVVFKRNTALKYEDSKIVGKHLVIRCRMIK